MTTPPDPAVPPARPAGPSPAGSPAGEQRALDVALRVGVVLGVVGLVTTAVIVTMYFAGAELPGTWAYGLAMLAPLGFAVILGTLVSVAIRRRRASIDAGLDGGPDAGPDVGPGATRRPTQ